MPLGRAIVTSMPDRAAASRALLAFDLRALIDVAGPERRVFVRRRMLDVAVDADRAAVHDAADAGPCRLLDELANGRGVDRAIGVGREAGLPVDRGDVIDDVDPSTAVASVAASRRSPTVSSMPKPSPKPSSLSRSRLRGGRRRRGSRTSART